MADSPDASMVIQPLIVVCLAAISCYNPVGDNNQNSRHIEQCDTELLLRQLGLLAHLLHLFLASNLHVTRLTLNVDTKNNKTAPTVYGHLHFEQPATGTEGPSEPADYWVLSGRWLEVLRKARQEIKRQKEAEETPAPHPTAQQRERQRCGRRVRPDWGHTGQWRRLRGHRACAPVDRLDGGGLAGAGSRPE